MDDIMFKLPEEFINQYKWKQPDWGPVGYITFKRTYARQLSNGKSEEYWQTIRRVVEGVYTIQKRHCNNLKIPWSEKKSQNSAKKMYDLMWNFKFTPPGRGLWMMGTDYVYERGSAALNNCFSGDTEFYTKKGTFKFKDVVNEKVDVLSINGEFNEAKVSSFGKQKIQKVVFRPHHLRSNHKITYDVTKNHRWVLSNGKETTDLKVGDKVLMDITKKPSIDYKSPEYNTGFAHGMIFGDGTRHTYYPKRHFIRLCADKDKECLSILESVDGYKSTTYPKSYDGDPVVTIIRENENWKDLPYNKSITYMTGFLEGWLLADASHEVSYCLNTISVKGTEWVLKNAPLLGYAVTGHSIDNNPTNFGERSYPLHRIHLDKRNVEFVVDKIIDENKEEEVFCVTEPKTHTFTLAYGLPTGNCAFVSTEKVSTDFAEPFCFLMDMSMLGVGVGGDTKGANKITIREPKQDEEAFVVPDTREGWIDLLRKTLNSYVGKDSFPSNIDYSQVREKGAPIKTFGGISSGPEPLDKMVKSIKEVLDKRIGEKISSTDIVDIFNIIGRCVVSGNVRRSAELMIGEPDDIDFIELKDPVKNKDKLYKWRWASNNSIFAKEGMDYTELSERTANNGEPGYIWLDNAKHFGRFKDGKNDKDLRLMGFNPCAEQGLEDREMCCLVEVYPSRHETEEELMETLKYAYLYGKSVTLIPTHSDLTNAVMLRNRRIGCSMSGIVQAFKKFGRRNFLNMADKGYNRIQELDSHYSEWLCVPKSIKTTTVKPSGTVSLLAGVTPGIHYPISEYYVRNIRFAKNSNLLPDLKEAGYKIEQDVYDNTAVVVSFPVKEKHFDRSSQEVSMWEQLENTAQMQHYWSDNSVSVTISFNEDEKKDIKKALELYENRLKTVSFLPGGTKHGYKQPPLQPITKEEYEKMIKKISKLKLKGQTHEMLDEFCDGEACMITPNK